MDEHYRKLERMYASAPINAIYQPTLHIYEGQAEITMQVRAEFFHPAQALHGSVYFKMLDDATFFAANSLVTEVFVLTTSFNLYLTRPVTGGQLRAVARVVHRSRNLIIAEGQLFDEQGRQVARGSGTFMRSQTPLSLEVGYH
ncbi:MAG TPA: PaaI family thioesterase [Meiothermus sp.]|nr:PaaI family thioesterase [Meiothermus sp.]